MRLLPPVALRLLLLAVLPQLLLGALLLNAIIIIHSITII
jgi:hypothetical protein